MRHTASACRAKLRWDWNSFKLPPGVSITVGTWNGSRGKLRVGYAGYGFLTTTDGYLACCWRAGDIARERCGDLPAEQCEANVSEARQLALDAGVTPEWIFPDTTAEDWLDCDQCRDCFKPAYSLRPRQSAQYALAITGFQQLSRNGSGILCSQQCGHDSVHCQDGSFFSSARQRVILSSQTTPGAAPSSA